MIKEHMYVLAVSDLTRSGECYRDVLGFEVREMGDKGWRMFVKDSCRIMAGECPDAIPPRDLGDHSHFGYLVVEGGRRVLQTCGSQTRGVRQTSAR